MREALDKQSFSHHLGVQEASRARLKSLALEALLLKTFQHTLKKLLFVIRVRVQDELC